MVFSFPGSGQGSPGWCDSAISQGLFSIGFSSGGCHARLHDRSAVLPVCPLSGTAFGFLAACVDWMVLCSGLLWCAVLRDWAREKIRFQRFLVFPWYRSSFRRRWMAGF